MTGPGVDEARDALVGRIRRRMDGLWRAFSNTFNGGTTDTLAPESLHSDSGRMAPDVRANLQTMMREISRMQRLFERSLGGEQSAPPMAEVLRDFAAFRHMYQGILSEGTQDELREVEQHLRSLVAVQALKAQGKLGIDIPVSTFHNLQARIDEAITAAKMSDIEKDQPTTPEVLFRMRDRLDELKTSLDNLNSYLHGPDRDAYFRAADNAREQMAVIGEHLQVVTTMKDVVFAHPAYAGRSSAMKGFEEAMQDIRKVIEDMGPEIRRMSVTPIMHDGEPRAAIAPRGREI